MAALFPPFTPSDGESEGERGRGRGEVELHVFKGAAKTGTQTERQLVAKDRMVQANVNKRKAMQGAAIPDSFNHGPIPQ